MIEHVTIQAGPHRIRLSIKEAQELRDKLDKILIGRPTEPKVTRTQWELD